MKHYQSCTANYPEKPKDEKPQQIEEMKIEGDTVQTCVDCGARFNNLCGRYHFQH